ncbi:MAG: adenylate/guanylate cyclase domain-containing protein [Symploca sp. SIO2E9]|nr:adenylate/guanylate cyclase domain-containing protein [Symploca sp. SIO2E9]
MWNKVKELFWKGRGVWISAPGVAAVVILLRGTGLLQAWEWAVLDQYVRWKPPESKDERIVIVGIDEADLHYFGQAIIPDGVYAQLLEKLKARKPRAIGLDIYRDVPVGKGNQQLIEVFQSTPNLVGIEKVIGDSRRQRVAPPPGLKQVGANDLLIDADHRIRRGLLFVDDQYGKTIPALGMYLAGLYLDAEDIVFTKVEGTNNWRLGKAVFSRFRSNDGGYVGAKDGGYQILLNYRGPAQTFETVSMSDILEERVSPDWGRDRIILIGGVGETFQDLFFTSYTILPDQRMSGVEIHAHITSQILSAAKDERPLIQTWADWGEWLWIFLWAGVGTTLTWKWRYTSGLSSFYFQRGTGLILSAGFLLGSTYIALVVGWWIPVVPAFLALGGSALAITAYVARTAGKIRRAFGRYLTDEVVANLLESKEGLKLGGQRRKITILTSDLRGFTAFSERLPAEEVINILNLYLGHMADVITSYQGTIDEFMGDGILVLFGAPTARVDDAIRAVACAVAMQLEMVAVNEQMKQLGLPPLEMGIGINTGEVVVGNIGSEKRTKYGVVGSQVNLTYRIESYTLGGQIIISERTLQESGSSTIINDRKEVKPKGVKEPINIYEVIGVAGEYNLFLPTQEEEFLTLADKIEIQYKLMDGKHVSGSLFKGSLVKLSTKGAQVSSEHVGEQSLPPGLSNIKLNLLNEPPGEISEDIYAKVLDKPSTKGCFYIHFTAKPLTVAARLDAIYKISRKLA